MSHIKTRHYSNDRVHQALLGGHLSGIAADQRRRRRVLLAASQYYSDDNHRRFPNSIYDRLGGTSDYYQTVDESTGSGEGGYRRGYEEDYYPTSQYNYGGFSGGGGHEECCPLVVDPLTLLALIAGIAGATFFLNMLITMNIMRRRRREVGRRQFNEAFLEDRGKKRRRFWQLR